MATVTVKMPEAICSTESPVVCVEVSYINVASTKPSPRESEIEPGNDNYTFTVKELQPDCKYNFSQECRRME